MKSPAITEEIQSLMGRVAALNRFLSKSTDKCRSFFKALKKGQKGKWDEECEVAFQSLKTYLTSPPLLSKPILGEGLFIYLAVSNSVVNSALIREELRPQHPIFYTSKALVDAETRFLKMEKIIFWLVVFTRKLRPYYQAHQIIVMTKFPFRLILHSPDASQRIMKWLCVDEASNHKGVGACVIIITPNGALLEQAITLGFPASNNEAEYEALLAGLCLAKELSIKRLPIYSDSQLITNQASGEYMEKHSRMIQYLNKVQGLLKEFPTFTI
ncbi:unnamed protein product [Prunus armeniaca]